MSSAIDRAVGWLGWLLAPLSFIILPGMIYAFARVAVEVVVAASPRRAPFAIATVATIALLHLLTGRASSPMQS